MIQITLNLRGKARTYRASGMNLGASLDAYEIYREYTAAGGDYSAELIERCLDFICRIFGGSFTADELKKGYDGSAFVLIPTMLRVAVGYVNDQIANFPEPAATPEVMEPEPEATPMG